MSPTWVRAEAEPAHSRNRARYDARVHDLPVADAIYREETLPAGARTFSRDTIALGWEDRPKTRGRRRSAEGLEFGTSLPRGSVLRAGDCLVIEPARRVVQVVERLEPAFVVEPQTSGEWGLFAYHIGNGHQPLMLTDGRWSVPMCRAPKRCSRTTAFRTCGRKSRSRRRRCTGMLPWTLCAQGCPRTIHGASRSGCVVRAHEVALR